MLKNIKVFGWQTIIILLLLMHTSFANNIHDMSMDEKVCADKKNDSAQELIQTIVACQNVGKNIEILPLFYLATDQHDALMNIQMLDDGSITVGVNNEPFHFPMKEWRETIHKFMAIEDQEYKLYHQLQVLHELYELNDSSEMEEIETLDSLNQDVHPPRQMQLTHIGDFIVESDNAMSELGENISVGHIEYTGINLAEDPHEILSNEGYIIKINGKYFMFNLPL